MYDFYVMLGCFGFTIDEFTSCCGVENIILKVNSSISNYHDMMNYFDYINLFDKPIYDINCIRHFIFNLEDKYNLVTRPFWPPKKNELYQKFIIDHKRCGVFIRLKTPDDIILTNNKKSKFLSQELILKKSYKNI